jgi:hypothetical protein
LVSKETLVAALRLRKRRRLSNAGVFFDGFRFQLEAAFCRRQVLRCFLGLLIWGFATSAAAQREWVELERSRARLTVAQEELRRVEALAAEGLLSQVDFLRKKAELRLAELDFQEALWQLQGSRLRVVVADCVRTTGADGLDTISLTLELPPLGVAPGTSGLAVAQLGVTDLQVSLVDQGVVVGYPYAQVVPYLSPGQKVQASFQLLRPVETPTVALEYRGQRYDITLYPRVSGSEAPFRFTVAQPSLAGVFGQEVRFHLNFEPLQQQSLTLELAVEGLPGSCLASFREQQSQATVSSLRLGAGTGRKEVLLEVKLPPGPVGDIELDVPIHFSVVARYSVHQRVAEARQALQLTPVGVPKLELRAGSWLVEGHVGQELSVPLELLNVGTAPAQAVRLEVEAPVDLGYGLEPSSHERLAVGEKVRWRLWVRAEKKVPAGEYTVRLRPRAANWVSAQGEGEAPLRVRLRGERGWLVPLLLTVALGGVAGLSLRAFRKLRLD